MDIQDDGNQKDVGNDDDGAVAGQVLANVKLAKTVRK